MRRWLAVLALVALSAAACRSSAPADESEDLDQAYVDSLATVFTSGNGGPELDDSTAECAATAMVRLVTVAALRSSDITPTELADAADLTALDVQLPADAIARLSTAFGECGVGAAVAEPFIRALAAQSGADLSDEAIECVVAASSTSALEAGLAATVVDQANGDPAYDEMTSAVGACPSAMTELLVNSYEQTRGGPLDDDTRDCVSDQVEADPAGAAATFTGGPDAGAFGSALLAACPEAAAS